MNDSVLVRGITVQAHCGAEAAERDVLQFFEIDLDIFADQSISGKSDDLNDAVNYAPICEIIQDIVSTQKFSLIEHFAQVIVDEIFLIDDKIDSITITLKKLNPPIDTKIAYAAVRFHRARN